MVYRGKLLSCESVHHLTPFFSHILAKKIKEWKAVFPLYYGWFLHITDTKLLMEAARGMIERCLDITEFSSDIFERTGCKNMEKIVDHYSWLKSVHSTSR